MFAPWRSQNPVRKTWVSDYWKIIHCVPNTDKKPNSVQMESFYNQFKKMKPMIGRFHVQREQLKNNIAKSFFSWLTGSGGGCKSDRQAQQIVSRCLKFLKFCCEDEEELTFGIVDFSLCSPNLLFKFVDTMQDEWKLGHAGA